MKYKVGDMVQVISLDKVRKGRKHREGHVIKDNNDRLLFNHKMEKYCSGVFIVSHVYPDEKTCRLKDTHRGEGDFWRFSLGMLIPYAIGDDKLLNKLKIDRTFNKELL